MAETTTEVEEKAESAEEKAEPRILLRHTDGSPVSVGFRQKEVWALDPQTGVRRESLLQTFNPKFKEAPPPGSLVKIEVGQTKEYFVIGEPLKGQRVEGSKAVYAERVDAAKFDELSSDRQREIVVPDNLPLSI
ncbi:MAG: hypothetical protein ACOYT7_00915 [Patescibacteria group bacterium]